MSGISFMSGASGSTNFKTKTCRILVILILSKRSSSYVTDSRIFETLKDPNLIKSNSSLGLVV